MVVLLLGLLGVEQSDQSGAQGSFGRQDADGVGHSGRLVKLEADPDVLRQHRLHLRQGLLDVLDD